MNEKRGYIEPDMKVVEFGPDLIICDSCQDECSTDERECEFVDEGGN